MPGPSLGPGTLSTSAFLNNQADQGDACFDTIPNDLKQ